MSVWLAALLRPFALLFFLGLIVLPISLLIRGLLPDGPLKDALYKKRTAWWDMPLLPLIRRYCPSRGRRDSTALQKLDQ
jgi:hypothetical protein